MSKNAWAASAVLEMVSAVVVESEESEETEVVVDAAADEMVVVVVSSVPEVEHPARRAAESNSPESAAGSRLLRRMRTNLKLHARKVVKAKREVSARFLNGCCGC